MPLPPRIVLLMGLFRRHVHSLKGALHKIRYGIEKQRLALQKERLELELATRKFAFEIADMMIGRLYPDADAKTKLMLSQTLVPNLLQLTNIKGLELGLPAPQSNQGESQ